MTALALINFPNNIVFNRDTGLTSKDITMYGRYDGSTDVEFRVIDSEDAEVSEGWASVTNQDTAEEMFTITFTFPVGGYYRVQVRYVETEEVVTGLPFAVGMQIFLLGDINAIMMCVEGATPVNPANETHKVYFASQFKAPSVNRFFPEEEVFLTPTSLGLKNLLDAINSSLPNMPVAIINCATNKSTSKNWKDFTSNRAFGHFAYEYYRLGGDAEMFIMINGESDAIYGETAENYEAYTELLIEELKRMSHRPVSMRLLLAMLGKPEGSADIIRTAQTALIEGNDNVVVAADLRDGKLQGDNLRLQLNADGVGAIGTDIGQAILGVID